MAGLTPAQVDFIENIVKEQLRYKNIMEEQSEVLRTDLVELQAASARVQQWSTVAACTRRR